MGETQPEQDEEIQAFRKWISSSKTRRPGIGGSNHGTPREFVPPSAVREYFGANHRVEDLLASLFGKEASRMLDADYIRKHYIRTLAIFLVIGEGRMIKHIVHHLSLQDHRLPYRSRPEDFPFSADPKLFERFQNEQWQFCATDLEYNMNLHLHMEEILPVIHKEEIGHGGNAVIYKIVVDEEYNKLVPHQWKMPTVELIQRFPLARLTLDQQPDHLRHTFVLKTYRGGDAKEQHKAEHDAFMKLRLDGKPTPFIVAFYGSFIDDDTYNILLEYADRGNLEHFMKKVPKPSTSVDMIAFWDRLCNITHGLAHVHGFEGSLSSSVSVLLGWHQDVKPANILVFSGSGTSHYDVYFKIADLSLSHFKKSESLAHDDFDFDAFGTRAYGAPETYRIDDSTDKLPLQIRPEVDIWSLGCVFSEAAVWSRFGWPEVLEYRCQRQNEAERCHGTKGEQLFHDGHDVLKAVGEIHQRIIEEARDIDHITTKIIPLMEDMLLNKDEPRQNAKQVLYKARRTIKVTRDAIGLSSKEAPSGIEDDVDGSDLDERPKTPPSVPPGYNSGSMTSGRKPHDIRIGTSSSWRPKSLASSLHSPQITRKYHTKANNNQDPIDHRDNLYGPFRADSYSLQELPDPPSPASSYQSSNIDKFNALSPSTQDVGLAQAKPRPHRETVGPISIEHGSYESSAKASLRRNQTEKTSLNPSRRSSALLPGSRSEGPTPHERPQLPTPPRSSSSDHHPSEVSTDDVLHGMSLTFADQQHYEPERPHLSLEEGLAWKEKKKKKQGYYRPLKGQENLTYLNERDHIFIIDNTTTMMPHRNDVHKVVSLLSYMLKDADPNGLDICFTQSPHKINSDKSTKLSAAVSSATFQGLSDMRMRLSHILQEHKNKFGTFSNASGSWYRKNGTPKAQKPLSFYVLTDGRWQPNEVGPIIRALVERMKTKHLPKEHVGIQFIRFGSDVQGVARLNHLDHGLGLKDIDMDIVDTTTWDGNVWKQLLGALNSWYDDDPD